MLRNINLTTKIFITILMIILGTSIISVSSYLGLNKIGNEIEEIAEYQIPINSLITEVEKDILEEEILTYKLIIACVDILSEEFKTVEKHIMKLEDETEAIIEKTGLYIKKAIAHNKDEKTKSAYVKLDEKLEELKKEQLIYKKKLLEFDKKVKVSNYDNLEQDKLILEKQLDILDHIVIDLMHKMEEQLILSTKQAEEDEHNILRIIEIISAITLLLSLLISYFLTKSVKESISNFQNGLLTFFKYLNKETTSVTFLNDDKKDEIGIMSKVVNENIKIIEKIVEEDKKVIAQTVEVLGNFEQGDLSKRVEARTSNLALNELTKLLNNMGINLEENIKNILSILDEYSNDNYVNSVDTDNLKEHFLHLAQGINILGNSITKSLITNKQNGVNLQNRSTVLKANMQDLSHSSTNAAASLEETSAALEEMTKTVTNNTQNIAQMTKYACKVTKSANHSENLANSTMHAMDDINEQVLSINEAITIIDQIAFQTNILSLNAAVEAATAGEAGKGFAVVAGEVRNLATRSAQAAKEIKELVEKATQKADVGKNISKEMLEEYKELNKGIAKTQELIEEVDEISKEQQTGIVQINDAVSELDQQTQKNSLIAVEASEIANVTENISQTIISNVNKKEFKGKNEI